MKPIIMGAVRIDRVAEIEHRMVDPRWLFPSITDEQLDRNAEWLGDGLFDPESRQLGMSFHSYLVRAPGLTMIVDTCNGNGKDRPHAPWQHRLNTPYLDLLAKLGVTPDDVDLVLCTHLHTDHVGWNTRWDGGEWVPTFPNARYLSSTIEYQHFLARHQAGPARPVNHGSFIDSVLPIVAAGQFDFIETNHVIRDETDCRIWLEPAPGHSPGHVAIHLLAAGRRAVLSGDIIHHPIQFQETALASLADFDERQAEESRLRLCEHCAETGSILLTGHFPAPTAGYVQRHGAKYRFCYAEERGVPHQDGGSQTPSGE